MLFFVWNNTNGLLCFKRKISALPSAENARAQLKRQKCSCVS